MRCVEEGFMQGAAPAVVPVSSGLAAIPYACGRAPLASTLSLCTGADGAKGGCMVGSAALLLGAVA